MAPRTFTRKEVEARAGGDETWIIIDNVVYDVSTFLEDHPGGPEVLLQNSGGDASRCFHDVGHTEEALEWRREFRVGELVAADVREVVRERGPAWAGGEDTLSVAALVNVWAPPLVMALIALLLYIYLFS